MEAITLHSGPWPWTRLVVKSGPISSKKKRKSLTLNRLWAEHVNVFLENYREVGGSVEDAYRGMVNGLCTTEGKRFWRGARGF